MYDLPQCRASTDAWWDIVALHMRVRGVPEVPVRLHHGTTARASWCSTDMLFSQTCGYPLVTEFQQDLQVIATPCYSAPGCEGPCYASVIVVAAENSAAELVELRGSVCAINGWDSHSGMNALRHKVAPLAQGGKFFSAVSVSGRHLLSIEMVADGRADVCAVDGVTHALAQRHAPQLLAGTRVLDWTEAAPALPYVARYECPVDMLLAMREALHDACVDPLTEQARAELLLTDIVDSSLGDYQPITDIANEAAALGYPQLR